MGDPYYLSAEYRAAIDAACKYASHDGNPHENFPNIPEQDFDKRFLAHLLTNGLTVRLINSDGSEDGPLMAPHPYARGYPEGGYIVRISDGDH